MGEFPDAEAGALPLSHLADPASENDELPPAGSDGGAGGDVEKTGSALLRGSSLAADCAIFLIRIYQKCISPYLPCQCRFQPSCSHYAAEAFAKRGFWTGAVLTAWRLMRCQPFGGSGYDPVPERGFRCRMEMKKSTIEEK